MELFLSHATSDVEVVTDVRERLKALGVAVYTAEHDERAGQDVHDKIAAAIRRCNVVVVLLTKAGNDSRYVHQEIGYARRAGKLVIPIVTSEVAGAGLGMLEGIEYILFDENEPDAAMDKLGRRVEALAAAQQHSHDMIAIGAALIVVAAVILALSD